MASFTYDPTLLADSELFQVRFKIGDTDEDDPLLYDEEIAFELSQSGSVISAAIALCLRIASKLSSSSIDYTLGPHQVNLSQRAENFRKLAEDLKKELSHKGAPSYTASRRPVFDINMMTNLGGD